MSQKLVQTESSEPNESKILKTLVEEIYDRYSDMLDIGTVSQSVGGLSLSYKGCDFIRLSNQNNESSNESTSKSTPTSPRDPITKLVSMGLTHKSISVVGDQKELELCCQNLTELDISYNQIKNWDEVRRILTSIKRLKFLNLKSNRSLSNNQIDSTINHFKTEWNLFQNDTLTTLILNSCFIDLRIIELLITKLNNLNELHLSSNEYKQVNFSNDFSKKSLKLLYFNDNKLNDWKEVCKLGKCFSNLEYLCISENELADIDDDESNEYNKAIEPIGESEHLMNEKRIQDHFLNLKTLVMNRLNINDWRTVDQIRDFNQLNNVRIQNIPLLRKYKEDEKYFMLVSHLGAKIETLNGSMITKEDRESSERKFIRYYADLPNKPTIYSYLQIKHGIVHKLVDIDFKQSELVQVKIKFGDKNKYQSVNIKQKIDEFKKSLETFVGHKSFKFSLHYNHFRRGLIRLDQMDKQLIYYNIRDGDEFVVKLKVIPKLKSKQLEVNILFEEKKYVKLIDARQTIGEFKKYLSFLIGNHAKLIQLFHVNMKTNQTSEELKLMNKNLVSLNINNGDEFRILLKNTASTELPIND